MKSRTTSWAWVRMTSTSAGSASTRVDVVVGGTVVVVVSATVVVVVACGWVVVVVSSTSPTWLLQAAARMVTASTDSVLFIFSILCVSCHLFRLGGGLS